MVAWRSAFGAEIGVWVWCGDQHWAVGLPWVLFRFAMGFVWVWISVGDRCLGMVRRSALGCGFAVGFVWVCRVWISVGGFWTVISVEFGFSGREVKIREMREMGKNRHSFGIYYFIG